MLAIRLLTGKTSAAPSPVIPRRARVSQSAHAAPTHPHPSSPTPPGRKKATAMRSSLHRCVPAAANFFAFRSSLRSSRYSYFSSIKNNWRITPVKTLRGKPRLVIPAQLGTQRGWRASSKWCKSSQCIYFFPRYHLSKSAVNIYSGDDRFHRLIFWKGYRFTFGAERCQLLTESTLKALFLPQYGFLP